MNTSFYDDPEYRQTNPPVRALELEPGHFESTVSCTLCGTFGEHVDWYWTFSQESFRTFLAVHHALKQIKDWEDGGDLHVAAETIAEEIDPIAYQNQDELIVCPDCGAATGPELRARIRAYADQLDEAGYSSPYGPGSDYLADPSLRDKGSWVRRHVGYELVISGSVECAAMMLGEVRKP